MFKEVSVILYTYQCGHSFIKTPYTNKTKEHLRAEFFKNNICPACRKHLAAAETFSFIRVPYTIYKRYFNMLAIIPNTYNHTDKTIALSCPSELLNLANAILLAIDSLDDESIV
jgi:hypothetical protein